VSKDLLQCQKRPYSVKRDLLQTEESCVVILHSRPLSLTGTSGRELLMHLASNCVVLAALSKETYYNVKRDLLLTGERRGLHAALDTETPRPDR